MIKMNFISFTEGILIVQEPTSSVVQVNKTAFMFCQAAFGRNYDLTYVWKFNGKEINYQLSPEYVSVSFSFQLLQVKIGYLRSIY